MRRRRLRVAFVSATLLVLVLLGIRRFAPLSQGLPATYYSSIDWTAPVKTTIDPQPSFEAMYFAWDRQPPDRFGVIWRGSLLVLRRGAYTFSVTSDDGAWLYVDDRLCVDLGGVHPAATATCALTLERGVHPIQVRYFQAGGDFDLRVAWAREGQRLEPIASRVLAPGRPSFNRFAAALLLVWLLATVETVWMLVALASVVDLAWPRVTRLGQAIRADRALQALTGVVAASLVMNGVGIWCGLPNNQGWFGDEITPTLVLDAIEQRFANGWWGWYPPVHYYVLTLFYSPVLLLGWLGQIEPARGVWYDVLHAINRGVVLLESAGILVAIYVCAATAFSKRAGVFAAAAFALFVPLVAYAKVGNIEVPYVFWFAISLVFYLKLVERPTSQRVALFAAAGGLSITSKDQAFALYLCTPLVVLYAIWRERRQGGERRALIRSLIDRRMVIAALVVATVFVLGNNLLFNYRGMIGRMAFLSEGARMVADYDMFQPLIERRLQVLAVTLRLARQSWGWPLFVIGVGGWLVALTSVRSRRPAMALTIVVASYYLFFVNLVMYCYDRFLLPVAVVQALFAGILFDRWLSTPSGPHVWRRAVVGGVFVYSVLYAGMLDALMLRDSRYAVERWIRERARPGASVGVNFVARLQPRLDGFKVQELQTIEDVERARPEYYVFDADYARAVRRDSALGLLLTALDNGTLGYERVLEYRSPTPWGWLPGAHPELAGPRLGGAPTSSLADINPTFLVLKRRPLS